MPLTALAPRSSATSSNQPNPASDIEDATPLEIAAVNEAASECSGPVEVARGALGDEVAHGFDDYYLSHAALEAR
jgi:hypothetical protein